MSKNNNNKRPDKPNKRSNTTPPRNRPKKGKASAEKLGPEEAATQRGRDNDGHWYAPNEQMLRDTASIPYPWRAGQSLTWTETQTSPTRKWRMGPPNVIGVATSTIPGIDEDGNSPLNVAARNIQGFVVHANSRNLSYGAPNIMMFILQMDSLYSFYQHAARMYGLIRLYSTRNAAIPRCFFEAIGWNYESFANDMVAFRGWLNVLAQKLGSLGIPAEMPFVERHFWMYSKIFADAPTTKSALYFYYPQYIYRYEHTGSPNDNLQDQFAQSPDTPGLRAFMICPGGNNTQTGKLSLEDVQRVVNDITSTLLASEDFAVISGDILKAFGPEKVTRLAAISEDYYVMPEYLDHALWQIHNSYAVGDFRDTVGTGQTSDPVNTGLHISIVKEQVNPTRKTSYLVTPVAAFAGMSASGVSYIKHKHIINMHHDAVDAEANMVATRLKALTDFRKIAVKVPGTGTTPTVLQQTGSVVVSCGSEIVHKYVMTNLNYLDDGTLEVSVTNYSNELSVSATPTVAELRMALGRIAYWDTIFWHPIMVVRALTLTSEGALDVFDVISTHYELENWTFTDSSVLRRMHECALLGEFEVPLMGVWNNKIQGTM